jgi:hypothetical protein
VNSLKFILFFVVCALPFCYGNAQSNSNIRYDTIWCGDARIVFKKRCIGNPDNISIVHVHENETTAVAAANWLIDSTMQGYFVTWQCQQKRLIDFTLNKTTYRFDPNRIYTSAGIRATLKTYGKYSDSALMKVNRIAEVFKENFVNGKKVVIALHNNTDASPLSINSYKRGAAFGMEAKRLFINQKRDADDFILTTEENYFDNIKRLGFNVVLQNNMKVTDDGSLSVYCGKQRIPYINVEAENGHLTEQKEMLTAIWLLVKD